MAHLSESILPGRARPGEECERRVLRGSLSWARERSGGASWGRALRGPNPVWAPPPGAPSVPSPDPAEPRRSRPAMETRVVLWRPQLLSLLLVLLCGGCTPVVGCNETRMLEMLPRCGKAFADRMHEVDAWKWCNLSEFVVTPPGVGTRGQWTELMQLGRCRPAFSSVILDSDCQPRPPPLEAARCILGLPAFGLNSGSWQPSLGTTTASPTARRRRAQRWAATGPTPWPRASSLASTGSSSPTARWTGPTGRTPRTRFSSHSSSCPSC
ncbi:receptor activity-modifying protein 3 isoform X1 [Equus caballus]|uniref:receptor activity-modifying protein 3 isoform X1 n=1 Tax=Equus caballus TaxID=9796 RepID=UPI0038B2CDB2